MKDEVGIAVGDEFESGSELGSTNYGVLIQSKVFQTLNFVEEPAEIVERQVKKLRRKRILIVKVRWNARRGSEFTWEPEDAMRKKYPHLFSEVISNIILNPYYISSRTEIPYPLLYTGLLPTVPPQRSLANDQLKIGQQDGSNGYTRTSYRYLARINFKLGLRRTYSFSTLLDYGTPLEN
ncbi:hypothetical protein QVD17_41635 [Tagetes erecta]|uniref:Uncharacterized protein n=1 Tax=Tagetes erecta TaxID=13708 RepID=A0AAD8JMH5_TARER|nr:hypothetical protein QVD17_41635 [Tagetes erecta]